MTARTRLGGSAAALLLLIAATPAAAQARRTATTAPTAPAVADARPVTTSWIADRRDLAVGDVITLYVDEAVIASARKSQSGRDQTARELGVAVAPPGDGDAIRGSFGDSRRASSDQSGDMSRTSALRTTVSVRILARTPDGAYQVRGTRALNIDKNVQEIAVEGVLRAQDVTVDNEADGDRLADAKITVKQKGRLGRTRGGILGRVLGVLWP